MKTQTGRIFALSAFLSFSLVAVLPATVPAALPLAVQPCQREIAKGSRKFLKTYLRENQKCSRRNLKVPGSCAAPSAAKLAAAQAKLTAGLNKKCSSLSTFSISLMGFPGFCTDSDGPPFSPGNITECMVEIHPAKGDDALGAEFGTTPGPLSGRLLRCQLAAASASSKLLTSTLKAIQECRDRINAARLVWNPAECDLEPRTAKRIAKVASRFETVITKRCTDSDIAALDLCNPPATTVSEAVACLKEGHGAIAHDLIGIEYADPPTCGDNFVNQPGLEECDGTDDSACPGACGAPDGLFPCLCTDQPRIKAFEFKDSDLDLGWTGDTHDQGVVEGGGYVLDLSYCDNVTDFFCLTGPHCSATELVCQQDSDCPGGETCIKSVTATGPHCSDDIMQPCDLCVGGTRDGMLCGPTGCPGGGACTACSSGATCLKQLHGPPLPLSGGGIPVCVVTTFTEDLRGTRNLATGSSSGRLRQASVTFNGITVSKPCPVCGGFCNNPGREICTADSDCPSGVACVTSHVCSDGVNKNKGCRVEAPFGGPTVFFGTTSVDCQPLPPDISAGGLDILWDPIDTSTSTVPASVSCVNFKVCSGNGETCQDSTGCPQGESCTAPIACWCSGQSKPNSCQPACAGGSDDGSSCVTGTDCASGVCRPADCRVNPSDPNAPTEGTCPGGPMVGNCSIESFRGCNADSDCQQPNCPTCGPGQTCSFENRQCFTDPISRTGLASTGVAFDESIFCIAATGSVAVNQSAGLPGPGAVRSPVTFFVTGF